MANSYLQINHNLMMSDFRPQANSLIDGKKHMTTATVNRPSVPRLESNDLIGTSPVRRSRRESMVDQGVDLEAIEAAVFSILKAVGEDPERPGLLDTPRRVARMYAEMFSGLRANPAKHLRVQFPEEYRELVLVKDIQFTSMCEHHLLPFNGVAHVAYLPEGRVTGLSKLARVVEDVARRPQVQERMTQTIADLIEKELQTKGVAVVVQAEHSCMAIRGVKKAGSSTITSDLRGVFKSDPAARAEFYSLIRSHQ